MRIQAAARTQIVLLLLLSFSAFGESHKEMNLLFEKYDEVMNRQRVELIDEVFTQDFLKGHGGKEEFITKVKTLPFVKKKKSRGIFVQKFKRSKVGKFFSAKAKADGSHSKEFILKEEDGKLKIDGTVSDG